MLREINDEELNRGNRKEDKDKYFVDLTTWPKTVKNIDDALSTYNDIGLLKKIQFKKMSCRRDENGLMISFTIWWYRRATTKLDWKIRQGIKIKGTTLTMCPVKVLFRYNKKRKIYVRSSKLCMHHDHPLEIYDRHYIANEPIMNEIKLLLDCKVPVCLIFNTINKKFQQKIRYADIYRMWKEILGHRSITEDKTELDLFIDLLEEMKKNNKHGTNFEYEWSNKEAKGIELQYVWVQTELMHYNSQKYYDIIYIDISNGTNKHDMGLIVFSGINHEKQSILLGYALVLEDEYNWYFNTFNAFFNKFLNGKYPKVVITDINFEISRALSDILTTKTQHLLCQWHVKRYMKSRFIHLNVMNAESSAQLLYQLMISCIFTSDPEEFEENQEFIFTKSIEDHLEDKDYEFLRELFSVKEKWARSQIPPKLFLASDSYNIVRAEALNQMIQTKLFSDSTLCAVF